MKSTKYFRKFLKISPLSLAVWRSIEAYQLDKAVKYYKRPILDIGCGFGEFAGVFYDKKVEVGIDIDDKNLLKARQIKKFKKLILADARKLPFKENSFNTIISNSVLEHIPNVDKVFVETQRVLKPDGLLIYTVAIDTLYDNLFFTYYLRKLGQIKLSEYYYRIFNKVFNHINAFPKEKWLRMTEKAGLKIISNKDIISKNATRLFDLTLVTALPSQISRWILGKRFVINIPIKNDIFEKMFRDLIDEETQIGSNLLVVAKKV